MQFNRLGDTGLVVSRLALGSMTFGLSGPKAIYKLDQAGADRLVARAIDAGVNFFNTADTYANGESEQILGRALGAKRGETVIATKVGFRMGKAMTDAGLSRHHILAGAEASLRRLGTDWIDVYLVHRDDRFAPLDETLEALDTLVRQGKVRYAGFSNWPAWKAARALGLQEGRGLARFRAAELYYSLLGRDIEHELAPLMLDAGVGVLAWSPLAGGLLSGKYTREDPSGESGRLSAGFNIFPHDRDRAYDVIDKVRAIAGARGVTVAQVAIAWILAKPFIASVLVGATSDRQLDDNLGAVAVTLNAEEMAALDALSAPTPIYPNWYNARVQDAKMTAALGG